MPGGNKKVTHTLCVTFLLPPGINELKALIFMKLVIFCKTNFIFTNQLTLTCSKSTIETVEKKCEICLKLTIKT